MKNFIQPGDCLTLTAPAGGVVAGRVYVINGLAVVATNAADATKPFEGCSTGVFALAKPSGEWAAGTPVYWDTANARADIDSSVGPLIGAVSKKALTGDATADVRLNGTSLTGGGVYHVRKRFTAAQVNAGAPILAAIPGLKIRMVDAILIAVGGNAATATSVDIIGTVSTARKLVAAAVAGIAQSVVGRAGGSNIAVLADGASFTANDAGTPITIDKTGSNLATATHIDVLFTYALDV